MLFFCCTRRSYHNGIYSWSAWAILLQIHSSMTRLVVCPLWVGRDCNPDTSSRRRRQSALQTLTDPIRLHLVQPGTDYFNTLQLFWVGRRDHFALCVSRTSPHTSHVLFSSLFSSSVYFAQAKLTPNLDL